LCTAAGIQPTQLRQPFARWPQSVCNRIAEFACENFGADAAMHAALAVEAGHFQLLELLVRTAPTVADGLRIGCTFFPLLHDGGRIELDRSASGKHAVVWVPPHGYTVHHAYVELTFGVTVRGIRREARCQHAAASEVSLCSPATPDTTNYERVLGCRPRFDMQEDRMLFEPAVAALSMVRSNAEVHEKARILAQELIGEVHGGR
jgi:hypothetical protein